MTLSRTRRDFFAWARNIFAGGISLSASLRAGPAPPRAAEEGEDYYDKLGVTKIINAAGTYTFLTASTMPAPVQAAVSRAAKNPVRLIELQTKAGEYLAKRSRCEAAMVTAGAASALTLGTSACLIVMN
jgi:L-seryl-tRNA(Ser) seleniumtransferase